MKIWNYWKNITTYILKNTLHYLIALYTRLFILGFFQKKLLSKKYFLCNAQKVLCNTLHVYSALHGYSELQSTQWHLLGLIFVKKFNYNKGKENRSHLKRERPTLDPHYLKNHSKCQYHLQNCLFFYDITIGYHWHCMIFFAKINVINPPNLHL